MAKIFPGPGPGSFHPILLNEQPDLQQGAFLAAITAKGPTPEEIAGIWEAIYEVDTVKVRPEVSGPLVENCGTGMDSIKTFNVSTAAALVAASDGVFIARHGARAITSRCGTVDLLESLGIDMECDAAVVKRSIEKAGIGIFNGMSQKVHPQALFEDPVPGEIWHYFKHRRLPGQPRLAHLRRQGRLLQ